MGQREKAEDTAGKVNTPMWLMPVAVAGMGLTSTRENYSRGDSWSCVIDVG